MKLIYYEFYPFVLEADSVIIIEMPIAGAAIAARVAKKLFGYLSEDYYEPVSHDDLQSATARDRGCEFTLRKGAFTYHERQGNNTPLSTEYVSFARYLNKDFSPKTIGGMTLKKAHVIYVKDVISILNDWGYSIAESQTDPDNDGCICRECKGFKYMAGPDNIINDGMLTCYMCRDKLKRFGAWPYNRK